MTHPNDTSINKNNALTDILTHQTDAGKTDLIVVLDTETTGFEPENSHLLEVAALPLTPGPQGGWELNDPQSWLIAYDAATHGPIPPDAKATHHITEEQVQPGAPGVYDLEHVAQALRSTEKSSMVYAAHNAVFDKQFLPFLLDGENRPPWICTWRCAMHLYADAPSHKNQTLRYFLGVEPPLHMLWEAGIVEAYPPVADGDDILHKLSGRVPLAPHRAQYDTAVTAAILKTMLVTHSVPDLIALSTKPVLLTTCRFGKHKGQEWSIIPRSYLLWMRNSSDFYRNDADIKNTVDHYLGE